LNLDFIRLITEESQAGRPPSLDEMLILNALWQERQIDTAEGARRLQKSETEARAVLSSLVESGLVESRGSRRGRIYHLSAAAYRGMGDKAAYIRQRGFEPIQQEQMVLQFVQRHGSISRSEAAELCRITDPQAYRLLRRLVEHASLKRSEGQGRSARYKASD